MDNCEKILGKIVRMDDAVYEITAANNGIANCCSLRNINSGLFLRHKNGKLLDTDANDNAEFFKADSSFVPEEREGGFVLHCSNAGMEKNFICKIDTNTFVINPDFIEFVYRPESSPATAPAPVEALAPLENTTQAPAFSPAYYPRENGFLGIQCMLHGVKYLTVPGNDDVDGHISLLNPLNGRYARHFDGKIVETGRERNTKFFPEDSSFLPEARNEGMVLRCVNQGMEDLAIVAEEAETMVYKVGTLPLAFVFPMVQGTFPWNAMKPLFENIAKIVSLLESRSSSGSKK